LDYIPTVWFHPRFRVKPTDTPQDAISHEFYYPYSSELINTNPYICTP
jgi:hypothetical protein